MKGYLSKLFVESVDEQPNDSKRRSSFKSRILQMEFVLCDVVLFTYAASSRNENLSPSAKRLLRLLILWMLSDHPYLVEVLRRHPFNHRTSLKTMLQSQTVGLIRLVKLIDFCLPFLVSTATLHGFLLRVLQVQSLKLCMR